MIRIGRRAIALPAVVGVLIVAGGAALVATWPAAEDRYYASNERWFARDVESADNYYRFPDVEAAARNSDVILLGHITGLQPTRKFRGEVATDVIAYGGYVVAVDEIISGTLTEPGADSIVVEVFNQDYDLVKDLKEGKAVLPKGQALWLLRSNKKILDAQVAYLKKKGRYTDQFGKDAAAAAPFYQPVGIYQGVFMQGSAHVESLFDPDRDTGVAVDVARWAKLSDLVSHVRSLG
ncbi:hypothetical protein SAMN05421678_12330 [Actinopolymorpha cephalotaxi]|uniref:Uncharacterized protein n=1 Tax=Actinopolymorpha cephalotaxi TaxID=504797 RepID=A0A1I3BAR5_9ACTN|nr:hypothetical protein [Actinopolymorpha cephalotaxi]NYH86792.1 hypothetical protein [Actinopolymorpha cephalotaxi]SFH59364.1 hypothetical protein SAMN05421678_12330 [Actinopolymorpha cephalotaxi]